ncbi:PTS 2-O-a-mannosyl-D-glycerate transporter subunit IIABC [Clostridium beijerinckii]|uniref:PTS 2-O-a-mannosyl-D-glycerate transporter subunit IIABC n=1 Tax=Clostridium beijerinckii TaxID=1520 RepID=UPI00136174FA|nr:PTS 2-O-a-mannosyl-D-glycerate transporter subunit IIABC [Clostridium beijerinckii]MZK61274.1 PTS 2-O-a-mannosyl-D-glycerate transporter subunit IIABC [Clostridium beijerinckii]MZK71517.1 PTS 2-O-a-mannosyl-D-glycerate transporter subunit IIABC [Clostridium beijerinckii]MZK76876.1 PTS 2-O-a-mannosyl-D-glycerate transporter subunit IIABC [Clostridium beijerinckii]MZK85498.1 PTS 2-O-a-mannosyl-D-glycerate transporter subunit IIABC [Clostridium beijerinckii]
MKLNNLTSPNLILVNQNFKNKDEAIKTLIDKLYKEGKITSKEQFLKDVMEREALSSTGIEAGLAIPHGKSDAVKEASFAVALLNNTIDDWESVDESNKVKLIFLLAIPKAEAGSTHLELLAELMKRISNEKYKQLIERSKSSQELYNNLENYKAEVIENVEYTKTIVAVTACPAGIAHTYMAAEALVNAGRELGVKVFVEKQGANGIEDRHTNEQLKNADAAVFAVDVAVKNKERYDHLPIYKTKVAAPLKNAKGIIENALKQAESHKKGEFKQSEVVSDDKVSFGEEIKKSILTGISHIIPVIVAGGMVLAFAVLISQAFGLQEVYNAENSWLWMYRKLGGNLLGTLMVPILSAYMAYSISDKPALGPGFAAGIAANMINGGFLAGMLGGFLAGYIIKFFKKAVPAKGTLGGFISFWVYPVFGTLIVGTLMFFVVGKPVAALNAGLIAWLGGLAGTNAILLGAILGIMVSFDLGGPVNKAAYTFCIGAMANGVIAPYAIFASVKMVSAFGVTFATSLFKKDFTEDEQEIGKSTWLLGLAGITEGAIPFMVEDPLRVIPSLCAGSAVTGAIVALFNIGLNVPGAGIFSLFVLQGSSSGFVKAGIWFGAAVLGAAISAALLVITRKMKLAKQAR